MSLLPEGQCHQEHPPLEGWIKQLTLLLYLNFPEKLNKLPLTCVGKKRYYSYMILRVSPDHSQGKMDMRKTNSVLSTAVVIYTQKDMTNVPVLGELFTGLSLRNNKLFSRVYNLMP